MNAVKGFWLLFVLLHELDKYDSQVAEQRVQALCHLAVICISLYTCLCEVSAR